MTALLQAQHLLTLVQFLAKAEGLLAVEGHNYYTFTQKRLAYSVDNEIERPEGITDVAGETCVVNSVPDEKKYPVLIRISNGSRDKSKKVKLSTVVQPEAFDSFWLRYITLLKGSFSDLKKTKKVKKTKKAAKKVSA